MTTKKIFSPGLKKAFLVLVLFSCVSFKSIGQYLHPLKEISKHYKTLAQLNPLPNSARAWMDTITFPW